MCICMCIVCHGECVDTRGQDTGVSSPILPYGLGTEPELTFLLQCFAPAEPSPWSVSLLGQKINLPFFSV